MPPDADIIVIGGGTFGSAAAMSLAERGRRVLVIDRFNPPHTRAEHHGGRRMFRTSYYEHPGYVPLLRRAAAGWRSLEASTGRTLFEAVGACYAGPPQGELIAGSRAAATEYAIPHRMLSPRLLAARFPSLRPMPGSVGLVEPEAGFIRCDDAVESMLTRAMSLGANVVTGLRIAGWTATRRGVTVETAAGPLTASGLIITAGPGSAALLRGLGIRLTVTRQLQAWATPAAKMPSTCWALETPGGGLFYGFPVDPATGDFKFGLHVRGPRTSALDTAVPTAAEIRVLRRATKSYLKPDCRDLRVSVCRYTNSPDSHFIIDRQPDHANVVFGAGFSGHGFKFAPVIGEMLADITESPESAHPAPFLSLARFRSGA